MVRFHQALSSSYVALAIHVERLLKPSAEMPQSVRCHKKSPKSKQGGGERPNYLVEQTTREPEKRE